MYDPSSTMHQLFRAAASFFAQHSRGRSSFYLHNYFTSLESLHTSHQPIFKMAMMAPVDLKERLEVLLWQEMSSYLTHDYIGTFQRKERMNLPPVSNVPTSRYPTQDASAFGLAGEWSSGEQIKEHWREIICEWAYNCKLPLVDPGDYNNAFPLLLLVQANSRSYLTLSTTIPQYPANSGRSL